MNILVRLVSTLMWSKTETSIRERGSVLYLGMATEILNLPHLCTTQIMAKEAANPKPLKHAESMILHKKYLRTYL